MVTLGLLAAACGGSSGGDGDGGGGTTPPLGEPLTGLTAGSWTWVPFPDSACSDGSPTGIGVSPGSGPDLVFFLDGGGACADALTCITLQTATPGPFGEAQFAGKLTSVGGTFLDRSLPGNPVADATLVFVPYCTGDVHGGDRVATYAGRAYHHVGHLNLVAFLKRVAATWPAPRRVVVSGSSAGGFGSTLNYPTVRSYFPAAAGFMVNDSGPPLPGEPGPLISAGLQGWGVAALIDPLCGVGVCQADLSQAFPKLAARFPADRLALLSWSVDPTITGYYFTTDFTGRLDALVAGLPAAGPNVKAFVAEGSQHTALGTPATISQNGVTLLSWLADMLGGLGHLGDGAAAVRPPRVRAAWSPRRRVPLALPSPPAGGRGKG